MIIQSYQSCSLFSKFSPKISILSVWGETPQQRYNPDFQLKLQWLVVNRIGVLLNSHLSGNLKFCIFPSPVEVLELSHLGGNLKFRSHVWIYFLFVHVYEITHVCFQCAIHHHCPCFFVFWNLIWVVTVRTDEKDCSTFQTSVCARITCFSYFLVNFNRNQIFWYHFEAKKISYIL